MEGFGDLLNLLLGDHGQIVIIAFLAYASTKRQDKMMESILKIMEIRINKD